SFFAGGSSWFWQLTIPAVAQHTSSWTVAPAHRRLAGALNCRDWLQQASGVSSSKEETNRTDPVRAWGRFPPASVITISYLPGTLLLLLLPAATGCSYV
ncbi:unnamed protein product, partial [Laminaria digitata]